MEKPKKLYRCDIVFGLALLLKIFSAGFAYFPILDDYIQYGSYPLFDRSYVYLHIGTLSSRPLASLLDPAFWGAFWGHMWVALLLISLLYFLTCLFLDRLLCAEGIKITPILYSIFLLLPITFEGSYWVSASSRLVVGMLFAVLAAWALKKALDTKKKWHIPLYALLCLLSFGFYESAIVFSGILQLFVLLRSVRRTKERRLLWFLAVPAVCGIGILVYYGLTADMGALSSRSAGFSLESSGVREVSLLSQLGYILSAGLFRTTVSGFWHGLKAMTESPLWGLVIGSLIVTISALCAHASKKHRLRAKASLCIPLGFALILLPLLPHILVPDVWLTYRSFFVCIPGLCILLGPLAAILLRNRHARMLTVFFLVLVFSVGCVNEVQTYKKVHTLDNALLDQVISHLDADVTAGKKQAVLVLPHEIVVEQTSYYKDHVKSVFCADWSLTGAIRAKTRNNSIQTVTPVYSLDAVDTEGKLILYMDSLYNITEEQHE